MLGVTRTPQCLALTIILTGTVILASATRSDTAQPRYRVE